VKIGLQRIGLYLWSRGVHGSLRLGALGSSFALLALVWIIRKVGRVLGVGV
jgi:hypothetical protein